VPEGRGKGERERDVQIAEVEMWVSMQMDMMSFPAMLEHLSFKVPAPRYRILDMRLPKCVGSQYILVY
jgi:hypothetical protein